MNASPDTARRFSYKARPMSPSSRLAGLLLALPIACLLGGCIVEAPTAESRPKSAAALKVPERAPLRGGALFSDKILFAGGEVVPGALIGSEPSRIALAFRALEDLDLDYQLFVHVEDVDGRFERFNLDHAPGARPTSSWKKGETIRDEFLLAVPANTQSRAVRVWFGFWHPPTGARLPLANGEKVVNDGRDRALLAQIGVAR